ncbi:MAG: hypothetical protein ACRD2X_04775 [Vicinamibacteraceae bacterium]
MDGSEVNVNQFPSKPAVYLDGGPGVGAPATAAGLDDGTYVFQVTDPSGKTLLSTDPARCRQFTVSGGVISGVVDTDCEHATGVDVDHGATTVQLFPFDDTPNPGGVYKVWVVRLDDFLAGCAALGVANGLNVVNCGNAAGNRHGFVPAHTKTDNFKVKDVPIREIDTFFIDDATGQLLSGLSVTWVDPLGASNKKWSYHSPFFNVVEAHIEAVEDGFHQLHILNQPGCAVGDIYWADFEDPRVGGYLGSGPRTVGTTIRGHQKATSVYYTVHCH